MFSKFIIFSIFSQVFSLGIGLHDKNQFPVVTTKNGKVLGAKLKVNGTEYYYYGFQGIPFAEPPIGERRFSPPLKKTNWKGILNATNDIPACLQPQMPGSKMKMSEDCLFLNVYTPNLIGSSPVMVYIYGGAFVSGTASKSLYGPDYLIQENVVLVVPNYRLGVFGFLSTQDEEVSGNNGLKDQILALEWVKVNIAAFGGNPDSVTIFGESAGSASVSLLVQSKKAEGLFHGAIMESGVSLSLFSRSRKPLDTAMLVSKSLNIEPKNTMELVDKLRAVSADKLLEASIKSIIEITFLGNPLNGLFFSPNIESPNPNAVLSAFSHESLKKGRYSKVPIIVGFNSAEGNPFASVISNIPSYGLRFNLDRDLLVPASLNITDPLKDLVGDKIKEYYFSNSIEFGEDQISKFISDDQFIRPTLELVRLVSPVVPTYLYEFSYVGSKLIGGRKLPGVGHAEDVKYLWDVGVPLNSKDSVTSKKLVKLWTNFAKFRNPTPSRDPVLDNVIWKPSNKVDLTFLQINTTLWMEKNPRKKDYDFWVTLFEKYGVPPYDTY